jgi:beta-glucanase (GH16 family)
MARSEAPGRDVSGRQWTGLPLAAATRLVWIFAALIGPLSASAAAAPPVPVSEGSRGEGTWQLVFEETFEGEQLNRALWSFCYWNECTKPYEGQLQRYGPGGVYVADGRLHLVARPWDGPEPYESGMINSDGALAFRYGYVEIEVQVSDVPGVSAAFWLLPFDRFWPPEIDIFEVRGFEPDVVHFSHHWVGEDGHPASATRRKTGPDRSRKSHVYGLLWSADELIWYLDGIERFRRGDEVPQMPMKMLATLAVGGDWAGPPDADAFPATVRIDGIRLWQRSDDPQSIFACEAACGPAGETLAPTIAESP